MGSVYSFGTPKYYKRSCQHSHDSYHFTSPTSASSSSTSMPCQHKRHVSLFAFARQLWLPQRLFSFLFLMHNCCYTTLVCSPLLDKYGYHVSSYFLSLAHNRCHATLVCSPLLDNCGCHISFFSLSTCNNHVRSVCSPLLNNCHVDCHIKSFLSFYSVQQPCQISLLAFTRQLSRRLPRQVFSLSKLSR